MCVGLRNWGGGGRGGERVKGWIKGGKVGVGVANIGL